MIKSNYHKRLAIEIYLLENTLFTSLLEPDAIR